MMIFASFLDPSLSYDITKIQSAYSQRISRARILSSDTVALVKLGRQEAPDLSVPQTKLVATFIWLRRAFSSYLV